VHAGTGGGADSLRRQLADDPSESAEEEQEEEYEIECICDHRDNGGVQQFRVRWRGYSSEDDTWEALATIEETEAYEKYLAGGGAVAVVTSQQHRCASCGASFDQMQLDVFSLCSECARLRSRRSAIVLHARPSTPDQCVIV
jgi:predicted Zn-ribbon and HTH transcriptional regulator